MFALILASNALVLSIEFTYIMLAHCSIETSKRVIGNSANPDQTPQNAGTDTGLHCFRQFNHIVKPVYISFLISAR